MSKQINKKFLFTTLVLISLVLISAFIIEYKMDHKPCRLCLYERIPYFLAVFLIIKIFFIRSYEKLTLLILFRIIQSSSSTLGITNSLADSLWMTGSRSLTSKSQRVGHSDPSQSSASIDSASISK